MSVNIKDVLNEVYQQSMVLGAASAISMLTAKFAKTSLGAPASIKPFLTLALALGLGATALKYLELKYKFPTEPFQ